MTRKLGFITFASMAFVFAMGLQAQVSLSANGFTAMTDQLVQQGWHEVAPGVLQRVRDGQPLETIAFGSDGLPRALQELRRQFVVLSEAFEKNPSADLDQTLGHLKNQMADIEKAIAEVKPGDPSAMLSGCNFSFGCTANAYPLSDTQGVGADSSAYWWNDCNYQGTAYAAAYGYTNSGIDSQQRFLTGASPSVSASIRVPGGQSCFSDASPYVYVPDLNLYYSCYQSNYSCELPFSVTLYGPSYVSVFGSECVTEYWSASGQGGVPPYSFSWNTSYGSGSGDTFTITFCGGGGTYNEYVNVSVTGYDSASHSDTKSMTTQVHYQGDPCLLYRPLCEPYLY